MQNIDKDTLSEKDMSYSGKLICKNKPDSNNSFDSISNKAFTCPA